MVRMSPRRLLASTALGVLLLSACSDSRDADDTLPSLPPAATTTTGAPVTTPSTIPASTTSAPPTTEAPSTTTTVATTTTQPPPPTIPPTTVAPTQPVPTPTSADSSAGGDLVLGDDGIGVARFGDDPDTVIAAVQAVLGPPSDDSDWVDPFTISACPGTEYRRVNWGAFSLQFSDSTGFASDRRHLFGYEYGLVGQVNAEPVGLTTGEGVGVGTSVAELRSAHPDVTIGAGEEGLSSPYFAVPGSIQGELTGVADDDVVMLVLGGEICGG
jgi:hypothetical protein